VENVAEVSRFNVVSGFEYRYFWWILFEFIRMKDDTKFGFVTKSEDTAVMVEYSSPNTNKPLHLGHVRNNLLGYSVAEIKTSGKVNQINDRGIHICKSMLAEIWKWRNASRQGKRR
jgi:arginyl-tRNA synthetase